LHAIAEQTRIGSGVHLTIIYQSRHQSLNDTQIGQLAGLKLTANESKGLANGMETGTYTDLMVWKPTTMEPEGGR